MKKKGDRMIKNQKKRCSFITTSSHRRCTREAYVDGICFFHKYLAKRKLELKSVFDIFQNRLQNLSFLVTHDDAFIKVVKLEDVMKLIQENYVIKTKQK